MPLRSMTAADAGFAAALTARSPEASAWSEADYARLLDPESPAPGFGFVAEPEASGHGHAAGFLIGRIVAGEMEILNVAVDPSARRKGLGRALVAAAVGCAMANSARRIFLEVRANNAAARQLYERERFRVVGTRRGYYRAPAEDALVLERIVG